MGLLVPSILFEPESLHAPRHGKKPVDIGAPKAFSTIRESPWKSGLERASRQLANPGCLSVKRGEAANPSCLLRFRCLNSSGRPQLDLELSE